MAYLDRRLVWWSCSTSSSRPSPCSTFWALIAPGLLEAEVSGREGFPLAHEIFAGDTRGRKTLGRILDLLKDRVGLAEGPTVVVDRGMAYPENLREIRDRELHLVVAARQPERDQWLDVGRISYPSSTSDLKVGRIHPDSKDDSGISDSGLSPAPGRVRTS